MLGFTLGVSKNFDYSQLQVGTYCLKLSKAAKVATSPDVADHCSVNVTSIAPTLARCRPKLLRTHGLEILEL